MPANVNFKGAWTTFWGAFQGAWSSLAILITIFGLLLVLFAVGKWIWAKRKGGGGGASNGMIWSFVIGVILMAPEWLIPIFLGAVDFIANGIISVLSRVGL